MNLRDELMKEVRKISDKMDDYWQKQLFFANFGMFTTVNEYQELYQHEVEKFEKLKQLLVK